jgi:hypothetical protein
MVPDANSVPTPNSLQHNFFGPSIEALGTHLILMILKSSWQQKGKMEQNNFKHFPI